MIDKRMLIYVGIGLAVLAAVLLIIFALLRKSGGGNCKADCGNKQCGDDGCGGTCGTCADGITCGDDGICGGTVGPHGGGDGTCSPPCAAGSVCVGGHCASSGASCTKPMLSGIGGKDHCNYFINPDGPRMNNNAAAFSCCMSYCGQGCCLWPGCMACGFDTQGNPNKDNVYLLFMNQPKNLAEFFVNVSKIDGTYEAWTQNPGTFPMFSNEVGHDWIITDSEKKGGITTVSAPTAQSGEYDGVGVDPSSGKYIVYGTPAAPKNPDADIVDGMMKAAGSKTYGKDTPGYPTSSTPSKLCGAMKWQAGNGYICGTFDGLGIWKWSQVINFFCEFSRLTGIQEIGLYDAQFLMPHWFEGQDDPDLAKAKRNAASITVADGVKPVPTYKGGPVKNTYALKLHLYLGGWPNFAVTGDTSKDHDATQQAQGMWTDICLFCQQNNELIKYVYIDTDASGLKIGGGSVQSVPFLTPNKMVELASQLIDAYGGKAAENLVLGAVITANPKYGFLPPKDQDKGKYLPSSSTDSQDQPGGPGDNPSTWTTPSPPTRWDGNNSYCQNTQYPTKDDSTTGPKGCPNSIQNAIFFMSEVNKQLKEKGKNLFTRFIQDGENNGTATAQYCVWWNSILKYMYTTNILTDAQIKEVRVGQAFSSSTNTGDISKDQNCTAYGGGLTLSQANFVALPELYWYTDYMKNGIGEKKYDRNNTNVKALLGLLTDAGHDQAEAFLKYGAGCEGCDHNHVAIARQTKKMDNLLTNLDKAQPYVTSKWLKGAAGPDTAGAGGSACITPFNTGKADKDTPYKLANCQQAADNGVFQGHYGCSADCVAGAFGVWLNTPAEKGGAGGGGCYMKQGNKYCQEGSDGTPSEAYGQSFCKDQFDKFTQTKYFKSVCPKWQPAWNAAWTSENVECQADKQDGVCQCKLTCNPQKMPPGICADPPPLPIDVPSGI